MLENIFHALSFEKVKMHWKFQVSATVEDKNFQRNLFPHFPENRIFLKRTMGKLCSFMAEYSLYY